MNNIKITADIVDYLGKFDNGVLVLLSLNCNDSFTEATLYYSDKILVLTVDESVEKEKYKEWDMRPMEWFAEDFRYLFGPEEGNKYWGLPIKPPDKKIRDFFLSLKF